MSTVCSNSKVTNSTPSKRSITLQEYRKQVGIRVINQKPNQKLGIKVKNETSSEVKSESAAATVLCPHCGLTNTCTTKCERCHRVFEKMKEKLFPNPEPAPPPTTSLEIPQGSKELITYGNRRPRGQACQAPRQLRAKFEEPQCVTLSSDEDEGDSFQEFKKLKCDNTDDSKDSPASPDPPSAVKEDEKEEDGETGELSPQTRIKDKECLNELQRWREGGLSGPFTAVECRSVRIGNYKFCPPGRVLFSSQGILLEAPIFDPIGASPGKEWTTLAIQVERVLNAEVNFKRDLPVIFIYVAPTASRAFCSQLGLDKQKFYWDVLSKEESQKRLTLLPISLDEAAKRAIQQAFVPRGVFREISYERANEILVNSSPLEVRNAIERLPATTAVVASPGQRNGFSTTLTPVVKESGQDEKRATRRSTRVPPITQPKLPAVQMFSWSDGPDRFSVNTDDYFCLDQDNLLNDSIIDFYLRYIFSTKLDNNFKEKFHVFSSFFYKRLTTPPPRSGKKNHPVEDDPKLSLKEKRHSRVQSWTKKVDIFDKDYLVIPINERGHWFLAIICFPGLVGPVSTKTNELVKLPYAERLPLKTTAPSIKVVKTSTGEAFHLGNTTITPVGGSNSKSSKSTPVTLNIDTDRDEAESDEEVNLPEGITSNGKWSHDNDPIKQPCILFFDSLIGGNHFRVASTLREYLMVEYQKRKHNSTLDSESERDNQSHIELFSKETMISACLDVPQQTNSYDCGVYILQYAESFMMNPFQDYNLRKLRLANWFSSGVAERKRKSIQSLLIRLTTETNTQADTALDMLPKGDVNMALKEISNTKESEEMVVAPS